MSLIAPDPNYIRNNPLTLDVAGEPGVPDTVPKSSHTILCRFARRWMIGGNVLFWWGRRRQCWTSPEAAVG